MTELNINKCQSAGRGHDGLQVAKEARSVNHGSDHAAAAVARAIEQRHAIAGEYRQRVAFVAWAERAAANAVAPCAAQLFRLLDGVGLLYLRAAATVFWCIFLSPPMVRRPPLCFETPALSQRVGVSRFGLGDAAFGSGQMKPSASR
jgi:hypothetical protein